MEDLLLFLASAVWLAGYVVGLGAVTVIDLHGFLGRTSPYWTEATVRTHKVTKPLIWLGIILAGAGSLWYFTQTGFSDLSYVYLTILAVLLINGSFLSFYVSPYLLRQERAGRARELLPFSLQVKITISFLFSFTGWWGSFLLALYLLGLAGDFQLVEWLLG